MKQNKLQYIILGIMGFILTIAICIQMKTVSTNGSTWSLNQTESELKSQVLKMKEKYENTYNDLQNAEKELEIARQNATNNNTELETLENEIKEASKMLGQTNVKGDGVVIKLKDGIATSTTLDASSLLVHDRDILNIINELRNAGAEAIEVNGQRIVGTTASMCDGNVILLNGEKISSPFTISAIGLPESLAGLNRAGGYLSYLKKAHITVELNKTNNIKISKYTGVMTFKYAKEAK